MARRLTTAAEKIVRARELIQEARDLQAPFESGTYNIHYVAAVKELLREARDLVKFLPRSRTATIQIKNDVQEILDDIVLADQEIFRSI